MLLVAAAVAAAWVVAVAAVAAAWVVAVEVVRRLAQRHACWGVHCSISDNLSFPVHFKVNYANSWWYSTVPSWPGSWGGLCQRNLTRYVTDCTESVRDVINEVVEEVSQSLNEQMVRKLSNFINEEELSKLSVTAYRRGFYMGGHSDLIGDHHWDFEGVPSGQTYIINIMVEVHSTGLRIHGHRTEVYQKHHRMLGN